MAGIYIHIPFCKQKCSYCDFHFSTDNRYVERMVSALVHEIKDRSKEASDEIIQSIYFGGGTPSILDKGLLSLLIEEVYHRFSVSRDAEVTLEANPDDISHTTLSTWRDLGVNRLSIGIQTFDDRILQSMNRAHDSTMALDSVVLSKAAGFDDLSVDLMYGLPGQDMCHLDIEMEKFIALGADHISAYNLTVEKGTLYGQKASKGQLDVPQDDVLSSMFRSVRSTLKQAGYEQYEVSNFARNGCYSRHNSSYWTRQKYLGIGPSAHSFDGTNRRWNISNNHRYMSAIESGSEYFTEEHLSTIDRYNEYILTMSRTKWGLDMQLIEKEFEVDLVGQFDDVLSRYDGCYLIEDGRLRLNEDGLLVADRIAADLFMID